MPSYSIALLTHAESVNLADVERFDAFRRTLPFASIYLYVHEVTDEVRSALQKRDITLRFYTTANRFQLLRRMFTEVDADVFALADPISVSAAETGSMIHQLVEGRKDMVIASGIAVSDAEEGYRQMCHALYGQNIRNPLSTWRGFHRPCGKRRQLGRSVCLITRKRICRSLLPHAHAYVQ